MAERSSIIFLWKLELLVLDQVSLDRAENKIEP